ncbi:MAG: redox-sensing transcriptional repressor Rex [Chloroflexi bacterium]|nr:redox-sensing transcriptional repressor Rex [Chloroflexota bacterium]
MGSRRPEIPDIVVGRLPIYLRALSRMIQEDKEFTSSHELAERLGISSAQIRKDLSHFGEFGKQGTGYNIAYLHDQIRHILRVDHEWPTAVVGIGDLGHAVANYRGFQARGFRVAALFDADPEKIGEQVAGLPVLAISRLQDEVQRQGIRVAMIATPADQAQVVANLLVQVGVRAILNYAPITLTVPPGVYVQYIDPAAHLQHMTFYLDP